MALVDVGATCSIITYDSIRQLGKRYQKSDPSTEISLLDQATITPLGEVILKFRLNKHFQNHRFFVVESAPYPIILGLDAIRKFKMVIYTETCEYQVFNRSTRHPFVVCHDRQIINHLEDIRDKNLKELIQKFPDVFSDRIGCVNSYVVPIHLTQAARPIYIKPYRLSMHRQQIMEQQIREMLDQGIIVPSRSNYVSPALLVPKSNGQYRLVIDYRELNKMTEPFQFPIPRVEDCLEFVTQGSYVSLLDLTSAYWQLPLHPAAQRYTAFSTQSGRYQFARLPFGHRNSSAHFQNMIYSIFSAQWLKSVLAYQDDIVIVSKTRQQHLKDLEDVFHVLSKHGLTLNLEKSRFLCKEFDFLGHVISNQAIKPQPGKVTAIHNFPQPTGVKALRQFLGLTGFYRKFIPGYSLIAAPLTDLLKKDRKFIFDSKCNEAFNQLKEALQSPKVLYSPTPGVPYIIHTDASDVGVGCVIQQRVNGDLRTVAFGSKKLEEVQKHYSVTDREAYAIVWCLRTYNHFLDGAKIELFTDNAAVSYLLKTKSNNRILRWALLIQNYDIELKHKPGNQNVIADALSRNPPQINAITTFESPVKLSPHLIRVHEQLDSAVQNIVSRLSEPSFITTYALEDGILYKRARDNSGENQFYVPQSLVYPILMYFHESPFLGHFGFKKTWCRMHQVVYWPTMRQDLKNFLKTCPTCQACKSMNRRPAGQLGMVSATHPFEVLALDITGPLPTTVRGNKYVVVVMDVFSNWPEAFPVRDANADSVIEILQNQMFTRYGIPRMIITDNGTQFTSDAFQNLLSTLNVQHQFTPIYHPQANPTERTIQTMKVQVRCLLLSHCTHKNWDKTLPSVLFALRTVVQDSTELSPAEVIYGRTLNYPLTLLVSNNCDQTVSDITPYMENLMNYFNQTYEKVRSRKFKRHLGNKQLYDKKKENQSYAIGDVVKVKRFMSQKTKGKSLSPVYIAPCVVHSKHTDLLYDLKVLSTGKIIPHCHVSKIFPYYSRNLS